MSGEAEAEESEQFVGYHGTASEALAAMRQLLQPPTGLNFSGDSQLGEGFYTTPDYDMAAWFADRAVIVQGGDPAIVSVFVHDFEALQGREVPRRLWWRIAEDSPWITDYDYLEASIEGFEPVRQIKFNPRAYGLLLVR